MKFFKKNELKLLWPFYFVHLFLGIFMFHAAFMIPYFTGIGLTLTKIGFLLSAAALASLIFEVPTGAIADILGRKFSVTLGIFLAGVILILVYFTQNFYFLLFLFFFLGIVGTLQSGAYDAWIVDLLKFHKRKKLVQDYYSKTTSFMSVGLFISGFLGAFFVSIYGISAIWLVSGTATILNAFIFLIAKEHFVKRKSTVKKQIKKTVKYSKNAIKYSFKHQTIRILLFIGFIGVISGMFSSMITWYPYLQGLGFKDHWFGYLLSGTFALGIFSPFLVKPLMKKVKSYKKYLMILTFISAIFVALVLFANILITALVLFFILTFIGFIYGPADETFFQSLVPSKMRATITSFRSMWVSIPAIIAPPLAGFIADKITPQYTIALSAIILIPVIFLFSKIKEDGKMTHLKYSKKIMNEFMNPKNMGEIKNPDGVGQVGNAKCGDIMVVYIKVGDKGKKTESLKEVKFKTFGCGAAIASSSILTQIAKGKKMAQAKKITNKDVAKKLKGMPPIKLHCSNLAADALQKAIEDYQKKK